MGVVDEGVCYSRHTPRDHQDVACGAGVQELGAGLFHGSYRRAVIMMWVGSAWHGAWTGRMISGIGENLEEGAC
ncbi:MAG: hypothetical protein C5S49_05565 [Candidatus Methanogaster sp.]|nr:MAG: hypothetical protein C5S49_05565 [ANME-2 cluster archaeon]